jgi:hypothetical protein
MTDGQGSNKHCGSEALASVRLAYGYAQYDYPQCRSFVLITDASPVRALRLPRIESPSCR